MNIMKKMHFDKHSKEWNLCTFYHIYMKNNIKTINIIGMTDRMSTGKPYLSWICTYFSNDCEMPLEDFLLWDVYYQTNKMIENCFDKYDVEMEPYECYEQANKWVLGDGNGSLFKKILDITETTPCGYYYGY